MNKYEKAKFGLACCAMNNAEDTIQCAMFNCPYYMDDAVCTAILAYDAHEIIVKQEKTIARLKAKNKTASETIAKLKKAEEKRKEEEAITNSYKDAVFSGGF